MTLKYQSEIDQLAIKAACPDSVTTPAADFEAFRFSFEPITHQLNFLPNVVYDRMTGQPFNYEGSADDVKCKRCGASYYNNLDKAKKAWNGLAERVRKKLGYTHLAHGQLQQADGLMREPDRYGHFGFYESSTAQLHLQFQLSTTL
jgi:hypothetical protein